jgi:hypothetical protein
VIDGASDELSAALAAVGETTTAEGAPKYDAATRAKLGAIVVRRAYGKTVLELCHLVAAADVLARAPEGYIRFFFEPKRASSSSFRTRVTASLARSGNHGAVAPAPGAITVRYADGAFTIAYARMPVLAALLEFLVTALGFAAVDAALASVRHGRRRIETVRAAARELSRQVYRYLGDHLPSVHARRKFDVILAYLRRRAGGGPLTFDDAAVLAFWRARADHGDADFKVFRTALLAFVDVAHALEAAHFRTGRDAAQSIGYDRAAGEVDPDTVVEAIDDTLEGWASPLDRLDEEPVARIRFLTAEERALIDLAFALGPKAIALPLSVLRADVFGAVQNLLTAARRRRDRARIEEAATCADAEPYPARAARLAALDQVCEQVLKAAAFAVLQREPRPTNVIRFRRGGVAEPAADPFAERLAEGERAFAAIRRDGFARAALADPDAVEGFKLGGEALLALRRHLTQFRAALDTEAARTAGSLARQFDDDRAAFSAELTDLYVKATRR